MRKSTIAALMAAAFIGLAAAAPRALPPQIDEKGLAALLKDKKANALLLDVRTEEEYAAGYLPGAVLMPYDEIEARFAEPDKGRPIVVYCRSGRRSAIAKGTLESMGYTNVSDFGAYTNWSGKLLTR